MDSGGGGFFIFLTFVGGLALTIFWMTVAWRAMRAHEKIADALQRGGKPPDPGS